MYRTSSTSKGWPRSKQVPSIAEEVAKDDNLSVGLVARRGEELNTGVLHSTV